MTIDIPQTAIAPLVDPERIDALDTRWDEALRHMVATLYPSTPPHEDTPNTVLARESQANFIRHPDTQLLVGIAGPGAVGKGTLGRYLASELGFSKVINTTTRPRREGEVDGLDYFFVDHQAFTTTQALGQFALSLERLGRGMYGISHEEITRKLDTGKTGCIFEENPANIIKLLSEAETPQAQAVLLYILPGYPIMENSLAHLTHRLSLEQNQAKQTLTPEIFESTLGDRQIDEFRALAELTDHPSITPLFIVNDDLGVAKAQLTSILGDTNAAA